MGSIKETNITKPEDAVTDVVALMTITTKKPEDLRRCLDHHIDYLIDMDGNRDIIDCVSGVVSYTASSDDNIKLEMLSGILSDISINAGSIGDNKLADVYQCISQLKEKLAALGY